MWIKLTQLFEKGEILLNALTIKKIEEYSSRTSYKNYHKDFNGKALITFCQYNSEAEKEWLIVEESFKEVKEMLIREQEKRANRFSAIIQEE